MRMEKRTPMTRGILIDLSGTVHIGDRPVPGAVDAIRHLQRSGTPFRFVTNTSRMTRAMIHESLQRLGCEVPAEHIFTAPLAVRRYLEAHHLRPYLLTHPALAPEFADLPQDEPTAVVVGFAQQGFTYDRLNRAFRLLKSGAPLLATGMTRYFQGKDGLELDAGPFVTALEYAAETEALVLGKPAPRFFLEAVAELGCRPEEAVMVGDDAVSDVGGALAAGLSAVLVQTGKYRPGDEAKIEQPGAVLATDVGDALEKIVGLMQ